MMSQVWRWRPRRHGWGRWQWSKIKWILAVISWGRCRRVCGCHARYLGNFLISFCRIKRSIMKFRLVWLFQILRWWRRHPVDRGGSGWYLSIKKKIVNTERLRPDYRLFSYQINGRTNQFSFRIHVRPKRIVVLSRLFTLYLLNVSTRSISQR